MRGNADPQNTRGVAGENAEADTASGGAPERSDATDADEQTPPDEELQEPSAEKEPGREPKAQDSRQPEPSHQAVGIGVIGGPQADAPLGGDETTQEQLSADNAVERDTLETLDPDAPPA